MQLPKSEQLNIASLSRLFDNKAECYKLFWFQAILNHVCKGQQEIRFEELIDDMIANAWYMVTEYHLNLGPRDNLEKLSITFPVLQLCCLMRNSRRFWTGGSRVRIWL